jgi:conjugative relaxase-like TrwC/TraI family protein
MFTSAKIRSGSTYLVSHLSANDYYAKGERVTGEWVGEGAGSLGLSGEVRPEDFEALRVNLRPGTGERLTPRTKDTRQPTLAEAARAFREKEGRSGTAQEVANFRLTLRPVSNRVAFFDFQCSAQKSVSILAVLGGDKRLRIAHERAARVALSELERFASRQNNTPFKRQSAVTGNICAAAFTHDASRALDPQLHTHFVIANATRDQTGKWYALNEYEMVRAVRYAGKVYQNEMARAVVELGYAIRQVRKNGEITGFEIEGVFDSLCERFSKRRGEIERQIEKFEEKQGRKPTVKEIALITRETRPAELKEIATAEVLALQRSQLSPEEWTQLQALRARSERQTLPMQTGQERDALRASVGHLFERQSVLREHEILAEALNQSLGSLDLEELKQTASNDEAGLVRLSAHAENPLLSECCTRQGLELEEWAVKYVDATKDSGPALNSRFVPAEHLSDEQKQAVAAILGTGDRVFSFRGVAGAGKTTTLREVQRGLKEAGHAVFAITPTASAAQVLRNEGFAEATTVEDFLRNGENRGGLRKAVVICDEAGLKSNRQGAQLLRLAQTHDMRVLLVGDVRQHVSVEAGDFLRVLETHSRLGRCQVGEIHRQIPAQYRLAITQMAMGDVRGGLEKLDHLNGIREGQSNYLEHAAADYLGFTDQGRKLDGCLAVSFTWEENHRFTDYIRNGLKERGVLQAEGTCLTVNESLRWTNHQKRDSRRYEPGQFVTFVPASNRLAPAATVVRVEKKKVTVALPSGKETILDLRRADSFDVSRSRRIEVAPGDKVLIRANDKRLGLINGQVLTISSIAPDGALQTNEGVRVPAEFRQWCHGYVVTSHKAQGWTADHVVVAAERLTAKGAYVACSRGRKSCIIHTPDKARLMERFPEGNRRAALDVLSEMRAATSVLNRVGGWKQLAIDMARQATYRLHQHLASATQIRQSKQGQRQAL